MMTDQQTPGEDRQEVELEIGVATDMITATTTGTASIVSMIAFP